MNERLKNFLPYLIVLAMCIAGAVLFMPPKHQDSAKITVGTSYKLGESLRKSAISQIEYKRALLTPVAPTLASSTQVTFSDGYVAKVDLATATHVDWVHVSDTGANFQPENSPPYPQLAVRFDLSPSRDPVDAGDVLTDVEQIVEAAMKEGIAKRQKDEKAAASWK
jgi:hypothetical protein